MDDDDERCRWCKHWNEWTDLQITWGTCTRIVPEGPQMIDGANVTLKAQLSTGPDFGCKLWDHRPAATREDGDG